MDGPAGRRSDPAVGHPPDGSPATPLGRSAAAVDSRIPDVVFDGVAVLDRNGRYLRVNPVGCRILGAGAVELEGQLSVFPAADPIAGGAATDSLSGAGERARAFQDTVTVAGGLGADREIEYRRLPAGDPAGCVIVAFRDVTDSRRHERQLAAFARAAESVAYAGSLRDTLDMICAEIVRSAGLAAAQILLIDEADLRMQIHGTAPPEAFSADFALRLDEARRRGADFKSLVALSTQRPVIDLHRKAKTLASPEWEPLHESFGDFEWDSFVSVPLLSHGRTIGVLNGFYRPGHDPAEADTAFIGSMADQAAIAVQNARLIAESKGRAALDERYRLARDLHDSACQELFSLTLELRAATKALDRGRLTEDRVRHRLAVLENLAYTALGDLRGLVFELHPALLHGEGLAGALRREAQAVAARESLDVRVTAPGERLALSTEVELELYRLGKEALHNAVKHAGAQRVDITLAEDPAGSRRLVMTISDDGTGFDADGRSAGLGLVSMRERAERVGGQLRVESLPGAGTTIRALVPEALGAAGSEEREGSGR